jgi:hypothetical protein
MPLRNAANRKQAAFPHGDDAPKISAKIYEARE